MKEIYKIIRRKLTKLSDKIVDKYDIVKLLNKTKPFSDQIFYFINNIIIIKENNLHIFFKKN